MPDDLVERLSTEMDEKELSKIAVRSFQRELQERAILKRVNRSSPLVDKILAQREELKETSREDAVEMMQSALDEIHDVICKTGE